MPHRAQSAKQLSLRATPNVLCLHIKRFKQSSGKASFKIHNHVDFPLDALDLRLYTSAHVHAEGDAPTPIRLITARDGAISARFDLDGGEVRLAVLERHAGRWRTVSVPAR